MKAKWGKKLLALGMAVVMTSGLCGHTLTAADKSTEQTEQTIKLIDQMQQNAGYPMLISIDQEGGTVTRLSQGTDFGGNKSVTDSWQSRT